jgi:hypothetical protein
MKAGDPIVFVVEDDSSAQSLVQLVRMAEKIGRTSEAAPPTNEN